MRIVFMGTPEFSVPTLDMLVKEGYDIAGVITQPDKPKGRGYRLSASPVKLYALEKGIPVFQPESVKTPQFAEWLRGLSPDLLITAAYGKILPKEVLDIPPKGCINVHASLLPRYRGAAPIQWAIINGEKVSGITTMYTDEGMDTGDILLKREVPIPEDMTAGQLHDRLSVLGAEVLKETLERLKEGTLERTPQNSREATYAPVIKKEMGQIDWTNTAREIYNLVRGMDPWPGAYTSYKGNRLRIWKARVFDEAAENPVCGKILESGEKGVVVACGKGLLRILELQPDSGRRMTAEEYLRGHKMEPGEVLTAFSG